MKGNIKIKLSQIKSKFFIKDRLFSLISEHIKLSIIKYNKKLQIELNININNYIDYSGKKPTIIIDIKKNNKPVYKFLSINEKLKDEYKLYINDKEEKINNNKDYTKLSYLSNIKIMIKSKVNTLKNLFNGLIYIAKINFIRFARNNIIDMSYMFCDCSSLVIINLSNIKTDEVKDMKSMFQGCSNLKEINLSNFSTKNVTNMNNMFDSCRSLKILNLSNFNTEKVTDMSSMFSECNLLEEINLSNFNTKNVNSMEKMFYNCFSLKTLKINNLNLSSLKNYNSIFTGCKNLINLEEFPHKIKYINYLNK